MAPQLLLNVSSLQSLSAEEVDVLDSYYFPVNVPAQFIDMLRLQEEGEIAKVIGKIRPIKETCWTLHYRILLSRALLSAKFRVNEVHPEKEALRCWKTGQFSTAAQVLSERWRSTTRGFALKKWQKEVDFPTVHSFAELKPAVLAFCDSSAHQRENLQFLLEETELLGSDSIPKLKSVFNRWVACGMPPMKEFAPYAHYCLTVLTAFYIALANGLIHAEQTERIDLEYLFYLPFCQVFSSDDAFHKQFAPIFLRAQQDFVEGDALKRDLARIHAHWRSMPETERADYLEKLGDYPPRLKRSITALLWEKHIPPRPDVKARRKEWAEIRSHFHTAFADSPTAELLREFDKVTLEVRRNQGCD